MSTLDERQQATYNIIVFCCAMSYTRRDVYYYVKKHPPEGLISSGGCFLFCLYKIWRI